MGKLATVIEAPIKGALGTEVNVGDTVMVVTTGYSHNVSVKKGIYKGYIKGSYYPQRARVEVECMRKVQVKPDGTVFSWSKDYNSATWEDVRKTLTWREELFIHKTTLNLNRIASITAAEAETVTKIGKLV
jgi:hypothetical protein